MKTCAFCERSSASEGDGTYLSPILYPEARETTTPSPQPINETIPALFFFFLFGKGTAGDQALIPPPE